MEPELEIPTVTVHEAAERLRTGARVIDVREQIEWNAVRVPDSELLPLSTLNDWYAELDPSAEYLFLCRSGSRSGQVTKALMTQAGFTNVSNIAGGILAWAEEDLPLHQTSPDRAG